MEVNRRNQHDREPNNLLAERIATFRQLIVTCVSNSKAGLVLVEKMNMADFAVVADAV